MKHIMRNFFIFFILAGQITKVQAIEVLKKYVTAPFEKARKVAQALYADMNCLYTNSCTDQQKTRIKQHMAIVLTLLGILAVGGAVYGASQSEAVRSVLEQYPNLGEIDQAFLNQIQALVTVAAHSLSEAMKQIKQQLFMVSIKGIEAAVKLLDKLPDFTGKGELRQMLVQAEAYRKATIDPQLFFPQAKDV